MLIKRKRGWEIAESAVTPEAAVLDRRKILAAAGAAAAVGMAGRIGGARAADPAKPAAAGAVNLNLPADPKYPPGRALTAEGVATTYNNYYEFSESKNLWRAAQKLPQRPWTIKVDGMVAKPQTLDIDTLLRAMKLEERIYRHRCVEAWAMTVPWTGFPMAALIAQLQPLASAKYVVFQTAESPAMPNIGAPFYPFPYTDGLTMAEATNELAFFTVGMFGKPLPPQNGGPFRMTTPWKYGFKQVKAITHISFTDKQPLNFWKAINPDEYGFWANVNPAVPHPRWSQAQERLIGTSEIVPTQIYNGYGSFVAGLYAGMTNEKLFM